jgi:hypothetical protein
MLLLLRSYAQLINQQRPLLDDYATCFSGRTVSTASTPNHCIELENFIRSCTVNDIYETNFETPETISTSNTADISHICEFGCYDWAMSRPFTTTR